MDYMWIVGSLRIGIEIMDYGSHGTDRTKYRLDCNRGLFLQSQDCMVLQIALDELKEIPAFILTALRSILFPYLSAGSEAKKSMERPYSRVERDLMRTAIRLNRLHLQSGLDLKVWLLVECMLKIIYKVLEKRKMDHCSRNITYISVKGRQVGSMYVINNIQFVLWGISSRLYAKNHTQLTGRSYSGGTNARTATFF